MSRDSDPTPNELQRALLGYDPTPLETSLIDWAREHWAMAARGLVYAKKEAGETIAGVSGIRDHDARQALEVAARVAIAERELTLRAVAYVLPEWLEATYGLTPRDGGGGA